jgi:hypothetical protein
MMMNEQSLKTETNTTDATVGQTLLVRVAARKAELAAALANPATDERTRADLQTALDQIDGLLTGDPTQIPRVVSASLSTWLEANKHLDEHHPLVQPPIAASSEPCDVDQPPAKPSLAGNDLSQM